MIAKFICLLTCVFLSIVTNAQIAEKTEPHYIKTIQFRGNTPQSQLPIINLGELIELSFDDINGNEEDYYYRITHHNFDWTLSDLSKGEYLDGFDDVRIDDYRNSFNTLQVYSNYHLIIPNHETRRLQRTGNYMISIYNDSEELIFSRKFMVVENVATVAVEIKRSRDFSIIQEKQVVHFVVDSPDLLLINPKDNVKVVVLKNNNLKTAITNLVPSYTIGNKLIYNYDKEAAFSGGNEYLAFDNKDERSATNGVRYVTSTDLYENYLYSNTSRKDKPYTYNPDINGNFEVRRLATSQVNSINQNIEADYVRLHFNLMFYEDIGDKELHIYGNFNNYTIDETTYMTFDERTDSYTNTRLFKQGFYNYDYVLVNRDGTIEEGAIGGNFWQTENDYTVIVYYRDLGARFDRIIGVGRANSTIITN